MALNERDVKFFRPLWIRVLVTAVLVAWCLSEIIWTQDQLWIGLTAVGIAYCLYNFFWKFPKDVPAALPAPAAQAETSTDAPPTDVKQP